MDRRNFLCSVTAAAGLSQTATVQAATASAHETRGVHYQVKGFTCVTCAVGLEVMLKGLKGVTRVSASYPANSVSIGFDEKLTSEKTLKDFIAACGFSVAA